MNAVAGVAVGTVVMSMVGVPLLAATMTTVLTSPSVSEVLHTTACTGPIPVTGDWRPPFQQRYTLTSPFGERADPISGGQDLHAGVDMVAIPGPGPVLAVSAGTVTFAGTREGLGTSVDITHDGGTLTRYGHLAALAPDISTGATVWTGQELGTEGSTGASTGNHLHFEVVLDGVPVDPVPFMLGQGGPLNGLEVAPSPAPGSDPAPVPGDEAPLEGGIGFPLPPAGTPRQDSPVNPPLPVPADVQALYEAAAAKYVIPWTLLAGMGMAETAHGTNIATSSAGARGLMQFMPATWAQMGVDGDGDGVANIDNDADSVFSAANYLTKSGVTHGPQGVREALWVYNHADWYVNDVLFYGHAYGGGTVWGDPTDCGAGTGVGNPDLPPLADERVAALFAAAAEQVNEPYVMGANGPAAWDCSSFTRNAYAHLGISMPRTARAQRDWLAAGNGFTVPLGQEQPGDLVFWDSYRGPNEIGHVMLVWDPTGQRTIEARRPESGYYDYSAGTTKNIFEIWRVGNIADQPERGRTP